MLTDPKINVEYSQRKIIAQMICKEIKDSLGHADNMRRYELAKRCENQYNQVTKWQAAGKVCNSPFKNACDYFIPLTEWVVDAVWARTMNTLFSQEPFMTAKGTEAADTPKEDGVTDFVDMAFREIIRLYDNINFFFKQVIKLPFAVLKYDWVSEYDRMIVKEDAQIWVNPITQEQQSLLPNSPDYDIQSAQLVANGYQQAGQQEVWVAEDKELVNAPQLKYIRFEDYGYSPFAKRGTRLYWEGDRCWFTINDMILKVQQEQFDPEAIEKIKNAQSFISQTGVDKMVSQRANLIECFHWYGRLPFNANNEIDFNDRDAIEQEVYALVSLKEEEMPCLKHWYHRRIPWPDRVYIREEFEETENFEGRSMCEKLYHTQRELNDLMNTIMNNAWIAMMKIFVKKKTLVGEQWEKPSVYPGAIWEVDMPDDIRVLEVGDVKAIGLELQQVLLNFAERVSNISIYQTGTARASGGKTMGEVIATIQEGNIGLDKFIQRCHNTLRKICSWTIDYYVDRMPPGLERKIRGEGAQMIFPTSENMPQYQEKGIQPYWRSEDLIGKFDFVWNGTSLTADKNWKLQVANDLMERFLPVPMISGNLMAVWEILKKNLLARGEKDWQKLLPSREAIQAEMQKMAQEAQIRRKIQLQPPVEAVAVKKLGEKGIPQGQAIQAVQERVKQNAQVNMGI